MHYRPSPVLLAALALFWLATSTVHASPRSGHYSVDADIEPRTGHMQVSLDMTLRPAEGTRSLGFLLHADLALDALEGERVERVDVAPYAWPGAPHLEHIAQVTVHLHEATGDAPLRLQWRYAGTLHDEHIEMGQAALTAHWVELPAEALWVPLLPDASQQYTWDARIGLPEGYVLVTAGSERQDGGRWHLASSQPSVDVPLIASDRMQRRRIPVAHGVDVTVHHAGSDAALVDYVASHVEEIVARYTARFGAGPATAELDVALSPLARDTAHSYARPGLIGLSHGQAPGPRLLQLLAHEAAHLWWMNSSNPWSRHNFLNESFAEYFAWVELGRVYGQDEYDARVARARDAVADAPRFDAWTQETNGLLSYTKGPLLLHELHARIGGPAFDRFVQALQAERTGTIEDMLATLEATTGSEHAAWLRDAL